MKLDDIIGKVATTTGVAPGDVKKVIESAFAEIKSTVEAGGTVKIPGMGVFRLREREAGDGAEDGATAARFVTFRPSRSAMGLPRARAPRKKKAPAPAAG